MKNVFLLAVLALTFGASAREKVIFDTDMGGDVDDALALTYLLCEPECDLLGVTVEAWGGNGPRQAEIVSALCRGQGRDVKVAIGPGAGNVLGRRAPKTPAKPPRFWPVVRGHDHREFAAQNDAVDFIRRTVRANPGEVTILATGQFTNLSALFAVDPELPALLKRLVVMGGNLKGTSEWNAAYDPVATAVVFANGNHARPPETLVLGADVTTPHHLPTDEARRFFSGIPALALCAEAAEYWLKDFHSLYFHDPIAAVAVFHPEIASWTNATVAVDVCSGRTTFESKANPDHGLLRVATKVDFGRFDDLFLSAVKRPRTTVSFAVDGDRGAQ